MAETPTIESVLPMVHKLVGSRWPGPYKSLGWEYDDLVQEVLLYVAQNSFAYDPAKGAWTTWVYNSASLALQTCKRKSQTSVKMPKAVACDPQARFEFRRSLRSIHRFARGDDGFDEDLRDHRERPPGEACEDGGVSGPVRDALGSLDEDTRRQVSLYYGLDGPAHDGREIARMYGISFQRLYQRLGAAKEKIRARLSRN
jgi:RNA polymerase sigma factor (sigma-70 family)